MSKRRSATIEKSPDPFIRQRNKIETTDGDVPRGSFLDESIANLEKDIKGGSNIPREHVVSSTIVAIMQNYNCRVNAIYWYGWLYIGGLQFLVPAGAAVAALCSLSTGS